MQKISSVQDADVADKRVVVRVDYNVPLKEGRVLDDTRIALSLPTLKLLKEKGASKLILLTHVGRPTGTEGALRVAPIAARLREMLGDPGIELRENLRFDPREEEGSEDFAKELALLGDVYVNEAFSVSHRPHTSVIFLPKLLPHYAGLRFIEEIEKLSAALTPPPKSLALVGGAKFETKEALLEKLLGLYDKVFLGGALADDILKARGMPFGGSLVSQVPVPTVLAGNEKLIAPGDAAVVAEGVTRGRTTPVNDVRAHERIVDIGPTTAAAWAAELAQAPFVVWNGPMGIYEQGFREGTDTLAKALAASSARALIGGGDTIAAIKQFSFDPKRVYLSSGGGAMLQFLSDGTLPGIEALK
ncbi:MAG: phosphoglycerate kinase [Patescibacteria group bacterium]|nr:phosphoglycerate kinase [Patescibacteria group bacterium]